MIYETELYAEDGIYTEEHQTLEDAVTYTSDMLGVEPVEVFRLYMDGQRISGSDRHICISRNEMSRDARDWLAVAAQTYEQPDYREWDD